ncbi:MAG: carotenoid oxygenase family protein [Ignavibacterium sp.]|nr:carotenoid oxygenase family protein [Ignavibacterium sp.]
MRKAFEIGFGTTENELVIDELQLKGKIPDWVEGTLLRNGPGTFKAGNQNYRHWFDGLAMLHKFTFRNGTVSYANKFLQCKAYNEAKLNEKISYSEFATDPCYSLFDRVKGVFSPKITDSAKVNVGNLSGKFVALGEPSLQMEFDPETLESVGVFAYDNKVNQHVTTVHPHIDNNEVINLTTRFGRVSNYRFMKLTKGNDPQLVASQKVKSPAYLHSFGMSKNYLIITEFPYVVNPLKVLFKAKPFIENYVWKPERGTRIFIFDRNSGKLIKKTITDAFFAFHHINAFEKGNELIFDIAAYPDPGIIQSFYLDRIKSEEKILPGGEIRRYKVDLNSSQKVTFEKLTDELIELPRFDYDKLNMNGNYQFIYSIGMDSKAKNSFYDQIVKSDIKSGKSVVWSEQNCFPGEPVFIRNPKSKSEDDGIILSVVLDESKGNSFLLVMDAQSFTEIARAEIPHAVLFGYHGNFYTNI